MAVLAPRMVCSGCRAEVPPDEPFPFRCPEAARSPDVDHVLRADPPLDLPAFPASREPNPFVRWRELSFPWRFARAHGMSDDDYRARVGDLDRAIGAVDGRGFEETPFGCSDALSDRLGFGLGGGVWVKDETGDVSGSHKARHLTGIMIQLRVAESLGLAGEHAAARLAIASCGNAALAASVVARAAGRELDVYVPPDAEPSVVAALERHGARATVCARVAGELGDPCYLRFREALATGALPFCCQGNENGLAIDGAKTLGYEMVASLADEARALDALVVQVGGGALATAVADAFEDARALGAVARAPRVYAVQTEQAQPLARAFERIATAGGRGGLDERLRFAAEHRSEFMVPVDHPPESLARGILDDETYDWLAVVGAMLRTGGRAVVVGEERLERANRLAREATGVAVCHTGTAGLAGLAALRESGEVGPDEAVAVLFTGRAR